MAPETDVSGKDEYDEHWIADIDQRGAEDERFMDEQREYQSSSLLADIEGSLEADLARV